MAFTVSSNSPSAGYIAWSGLHIQFAGAAYAITDGNTDKVYAWWTPSVPNNLVVSDTFPTLTANDCLVFLNKSGIAIVVPTSTILDGDLIVPGTVLAAHLAANSVTADKIMAGAVTAGALAAGSVTANAVAAAAIGAEKIAAGAITADKLFVTDTTNMTSYDPDLYPAGIATETVSGVNYFKRGSATSTYTVMDFAIAKLCTFSVSDQFKFRFYGFKEASVVTLRAMVRYYYTDGTSPTCGYTNLSVTETPGYAEAVVTITGALDASKTLSYVRFYVLTSVPSIGYWYLRDLSLMRLTNGALIVDGTVTATKIGANQVTTDHLAALAVTAGKVDIADLFAAAATINAIRTMTVASLLNGSVLELNESRAAIRTPEFLVEIPGAEEGEEKLRIDADGAYLPKLGSPVVARRVPGGVYTVYSNADYDTLADAFADLAGVVLDSDVVLKLGRDDAGGVLRGTRGGHRVIITSGNLIYRVTASTYYAVLNLSGDYGYQVKATSAGTYRSVVIPVGRVGDLGIAGKNLTFACGGVNVVNGTTTLIQCKVMDDDYNSSYGVFLGSLTAANSSRTVTVPEDTDDDKVIGLVMYASFSTSCPVDAWVTYDSVKCEIGDSVYGWPTAQYKVADLETVGCDRVNLARLTLQNGVRVRGGIAAISRCELYGAVGVLADAARVRMHDNKGTCTKAVTADCAQVQVTGPAPGGTYEGWLVDTTGATISGSGSVPTEITKTLTALLTGSYCSTSGWIGDNYVRQGYTTSRGRHRGLIYFDLSSIPAGATVSAMQLTIKRLADYGKGDVVTVKAYGSTATAKSGTPALSSAGYVLGTIGEGKTKTFDLPADLVTGLAAGTYKSILLYADDTTVLNDKTYSTNFALFDGVGGVVPKLAVTYTA